MVKVTLLLCVMAAVLVCAKPNGKQEESVVVTFVDLIHERPNRPAGESPGDATGSLTRATGSYCNAAKHRYACDGTCFPIDAKYRTWEVTGFDSSHQAAIDYFARDDCIINDEKKDHIGTTLSDADQCYAHKDPNSENAISFSCVIVPSTNCPTPKP